MTERTVTQTVAPYGAWRSPVSVDDAVGAARGPSPMGDRQRRAVVRRGASRQKAADQIVRLRRMARPRTIAARSQRPLAGSEYGGGARCCPIRVISIRQRPRPAHLARPAGGKPQPLTAEGPCASRHDADPLRSRLIAVRGGSFQSGGARRTASSPSTSPAARWPLWQDSDFAARAPCADGDRIAWIAWDHQHAGRTRPR